MDTKSKNSKKWLGNLLCILVVVVLAAAAVVLVASEEAVKANGSMGSASKTLKLGGVDPAIEGQFEVDGIQVGGCCSVHN